MPDTHRYLSLSSTSLPRQPAKDSDNGGVRRAIVALARQERAG
jgi:hypothetical protein